MHHSPMRLHVEVCPRNDFREVTVASIGGENCHRTKVVKKIPQVTQKLGLVLQPVFQQ